MEKGPNGEYSSDELASGVLLSPLTSKKKGKLRIGKLRIGGTATDAERTEVDLYAP